MKLMGIESSRVKGTSRNRLYACLGLRWFTRKESKDHSVRREKRDDKQREKTEEQDKELLEALYLFVHHVHTTRVFETHQIN